MSFYSNPDFSKMTPEQVAYYRARLTANQPNYGHADYIGSGLSQLTFGIKSGQQFRAMDAREGQGA